MSRSASTVLVIAAGEGPSKCANDGANGDDDEGAADDVESDSRKAVRRGEVRIVTGSSSRIVEKVI